MSSVSSLTDDQSFLAFDQTIPPEHPLELTTTEPVPETTSVVDPITAPMEAVEQATVTV